MVSPPEAPDTTVEDPDEDTVLTPPRTAEPVPDGVDGEDTIVREWKPPPARTSPPVEAPIPLIESSPHYRFRIGEKAEPVLLDVPAYIGRRPSSPRIKTGQVPQLIVVDSPLHEVSSTHLEVRQLGTSVIVTDMRSTNGSLVIVPGNAARKLRQGESVVVSPGTLVDIGDGNIVEILPTQRLSPI